jgi:DNA-binding transcriptional LysR family regulator
MLNSIYLQTFLAVVEAGSYTAAAEHLHMSQPAVSQHIRALEEQLDGVRLFRRLGQRMVPTHAGEQLLVTARELMALVERAEHDLKALKGKIAGRVTIGCTSSSGEHLLPPLLAAFRTRFPAVELGVMVAPCEVLFAALTAQHISLMLIEEQQRRRGWEGQFLGREGLSLLVRHDHPFCEKECIAPEELRKQPLVLPCTGSPLRRTIEDGLRRRGVTGHDLVVTLETDSVLMVLQGVRNGLGLTFVPTTCLALAQGLHRMELSGAPLQQEWYVIRERQREPPRAAAELYAFLSSPVAAEVLMQFGLAGDTREHGK